MRSSWVVGLVFVVSACAVLPPSRPATKQSDAGKAVAEKFWVTLHEGRFDEVDGLIEEHLRVLVDEPSDPITVAHVGFLHAWKLAESHRKPREASVIQSASLARRYFEEAVALDGTDARYLGFFASFTMAEGSILKNETQTREGYFTMKEAVARWPEFNLFTSGYTMSTNDVTDSTFKEGLAQQWETLDRCFGERVSRQAPNLSKYLSLETTTGPKRACWNSVIAPHNWEGFFLNFGDMLIRSGDTTNARAMYEAAKLSKTYDAWVYRGVLERRLAKLDTLQTAFASAERTEPETVTMFSSAFACMGCHQEKGTPSVAP